MNDPYVEEHKQTISKHESDSSPETNNKYSNQNGGNFIITKHEHKILPIFSRKYTLDQGTAQPGTPELHATKPYGKYNKEHSIDVEVPLTPLPKRGILKNNHSEPYDIPDTPPRVRHTLSEGDLHTKRNYRLHFPHFKRKTQDSSQEFTNPAFEPDDTVPKDFKFRDLVAQVLRQQNDDAHHPYGRTDLYTTVFVGHDPKTAEDTDSSKLAFWGILLFIILGITCGIIFMAEMHKLEDAQQNNSTTSG